MDRELWLDVAFRNAEIHEWPCPKCKGHLAIKSDSFRYAYSAQTQYLIDEYRALNADTDEGVFSAIMKCRKCGEHFSMAGEYHPEAVTEYEDTGQPCDVYYSFYFPKFIFPTMRLFRIPKSCPKEVVDELDRSFSLYWSDLDASMNKIRLALERLMDAHGVPSANKDLHSRITDFCKTRIEYEDLLLALKCIGNEGSHKSGTITRKIAIDVYEIIELTLINMYDTKEQDIRNRAKEIRNNKGSL